MNRYNLITRKHPREIVLLKGKPCIWGKCTFCDYIEDNSADEAELDTVNSAVLERVRGANGVLEVINSGSCFELPHNTLLRIRKTIREKQIGRLFMESHWLYRQRLEEMRAFMGVPITFKIGVETFDDDFRERVLCKHAPFRSPGEVAAYFDSPCLLVGVHGQTKDMIARDIRILKQYFPMGTVNVFTNNTTSIRQDPALVAWFAETYAWLEDDPDVEVLYENTDFGVGD